MTRTRRPAFRWARALCRRAVAMAVIGLAGHAAPAASQGLQVAPVNLELPAGQTVTTITVSNNTDRATGMQVRSFDWRQQGGQDVLSPTQVVEVSPPIFELPAGGSQLVRVVLRSPPDAKEAAYRLLFDQLPTPGSTGITLALRFSIPLFAAPQFAASPELETHVERQGAGAVLVVRNSGTRHDRLFAPSLLAGGAKIGLSGNTNFYVLAGCEQRWPLAGKLATLRPGAHAQLTATTSAGRVDRAVAVLGP